LNHTKTRSPWTWTLALLLGSVTGCFEGQFLAGRPCDADSDCGPSLSCEAGVCGGYTCPVELVDGECPCPGPSTHACTQLSQSTNKVDILLVIDNSGSMDQLAIAKLAAPLVTTLDQTLADFRIAVTTTDNGNPWCPPDITTPESGRFVFSSCRARLPDFLWSNDTVDQRQVCVDYCPHESVSAIATAIDGDPTLAPRPWLAGSPTGSNLVDDLSIDEALPCLLLQGLNGCGFEQQLESLQLALDHSSDPLESNYGFLRDDAHLLVVIVTDEADGSYNPDWASIFESDGNKVFWSDPMSAFPTSAVTWNAGVACTGGPTPYDDCVPTEFDVDGQPTSDPAAAVLWPVGRYVDKLTEISAAKQAVNDKLGVSLTLIAGVPDGFDGTMTYSAGNDPEYEYGFGIGPGCEAVGSESKGVPPARMLAVLDQLPGTNNRAYSICSEEFGGAFEAITQTLAESLPAQCMQACVADKLAGPAGVQPDCVLAYPLDGTSIEIPSCGLDELSRPILGDDALCYYVRGGAVAEGCSSMGWNVQFGFLTASGSSIPNDVYASCEPSAEPEIDCPVG